MPLTEAQKRACTKYHSRIRLDPEYKKKKREYAAKYRKENAAKVAACLHEWYLKNKETHRANAKRWATENKEKDLRNHAKWVANNRGKVLKSSKKCRKRMYDGLEDGYVLGVITNHSTLSFKDIPQSMIVAKRAELQFQRLIKDHNNE